VSKSVVVQLDYPRAFFAHTLYRALTRLICDGCSRDIKKGQYFTRRASKSSDAPGIRYTFCASCRPIDGYTNPHPCSGCGQIVVGETDTCSYCRRQNRGATKEMIVSQFFDDYLNKLVDGKHQGIEATLMRAHQAALRKIKAG
jgi:hypothetical protein